MAVAQQSQQPLIHHLGRRQKAAGVGDQDLLGFGHFGKKRRVNGRVGREASAAGWEGNEGRLEESGDGLRGQCLLARVRPAQGWACHGDLLSEERQECFVGCVREASTAGFTTEPSTSKHSGTVTSMVPRPSPGSRVGVPGHESVFVRPPGQAEQRAPHGVHGPQRSEDECGRQETERRSEERGLHAPLRDT
jgi:hypothetical protein